MFCRFWLPCESLGLTAIGQSCHELVSELAGLVEVVLLDIGRRYLDPEVFLAVLALPEVTEEGEQRVHLTTFVGEMNAVGEDAAACPSPFSAVS